MHIPKTLRLWFLRHKRSNKRIPEILVLRKPAAAPRWIPRPISAPRKTYLSASTGWRMVPAPPVLGFSVLPWPCLADQVGIRGAPHCMRSSHFPWRFPWEAQAASLAFLQVGNYLASCSNPSVVSVVGESLLHSHVIDCWCPKASFQKSVTFCPRAWLPFTGGRGCLRTTWPCLSLLREVENWN